MRVSMFCTEPMFTVFTVKILTEGGYIGLAVSIFTYAFTAFPCLFLFVCRYSLNSLLFLF